MIAVGAGGVGGDVGTGLWLGITGSVGGGRVGEGKAVATGSVALGMLLAAGLEGKGVVGGWDGLPAVGVAVCKSPPGGMAVREGCSAAGVAVRASVRVKIEASVGEEVGETGAGEGLDLGPRSGIGNWSSPRICRAGISAG